MDFHSGKTQTSSSFRRKWHHSLFGCAGTITIPPAPSKRRLYAIGICLFGIIGIAALSLAINQNEGDAVEILSVLLCVMSTVPLLGFLFFLNEAKREHRHSEQERRHSQLALERMSKELWDTKTRTTLILDGIGEGVIAVDLDSNVMMLNPAAKMLLGIFDDPLGRPIVDLFTHCLISPSDMRTIEQEECFRRIAVEVPGEPSVVLELACSSFKNEQADPGGRVFILRDVTKERAIDRMKNQFVSSVSHELRTPLTSIKGFTTTILRDKEMPQETREYFLGIIEEESSRLAMLIEDLLEISRIEAGQIKLTLSPLDLRAIILKTVHALQPEANRRCIDLQCNVSDIISSPTGDAEKIQSVIVNLVSNAIKFSPDNGTVKVNADERDDVVHIRVTDNGPGIPERDMARVFDRFYRVHMDDNGAAGTGLGLAIAKDFVERHNGRIDVESIVGEGSTFTVLLPVSTMLCRKTAEEVTA